MKGITPVVAIILLLMITISMVGFAFIWFSRMFESVSGGVENQTLTELETMRKKIDIENVDTSGSPNVVTIRNIGSANIPSNQLSFYIDNVFATCTFAATTIAVGTVEVCDLSAACGAGAKLKVSAPGNTAIYTC